MAGRPAAPGFVSKGGHIVDSTLAAPPRPHASADGKAAIKAGRTAKEIRPNEPAKAAQKDTDAHWTAEFRKAKAKPDDIAIPVFDC